MKTGDTKEESRKYFFWAITIILIFLSYLVIKDFIVAIISAFILAYLAKPAFDKMRKKIGDSPAAGVCLLTIILMVIIPLGLLAGEVTRQATKFIKNPVTIEFFSKVSTTPLLQELNINVADLTQKSLSFLVKIITSVATQIPSLVISLLIISLGVFYILLKWEELTKALRKYIPFEDKDRLIKEISKSTKNIIYGSVLIATIEFIVALVGFYLLKTEFFVLLSIIIFFLAFFPGLGPTIVWVPLAIYNLFLGNIIIGIGIIVLGLILNLGIDTFLRGKILGEKTNINPLIMLIGILGGISVFGIFGFIIGPIILVYTIKLIDEILEQKQN